jgi:hypothetical protein
VHGECTEEERGHTGSEVGNRGENSRVEGSTESEVTAVAHAGRANATSTIRVVDESSYSLLAVLVRRREQLLDLRRSRKG